MEVFFVRHAETKPNSLYIFQGDTAELSEYGLRQAKNLANRFSGVKIGVIISSRQKRSMRTARIINRVVKKSILYTGLLNELRRPSELLGLRYDSPKAVEIRSAANRHTDDPSWRYSDEESFAEFRKRVIRFLHSLSKRREKSVLVVTHGNVLRMVIGILMFGEDIDPAKFNTLRQLFHTINTGVTELVLNGEGRWKLITWNDYAHLK